MPPPTIKPPIHVAQGEAADRATARPAPVMVIAPISERMVRLML
jgi:hypothetical protein